MVTLQAFEAARRKRPGTTTSRSRLRIVVAGSIASVPGQGGWTWVVLQYVLGLRRLGHDVVLVDPVEPSLVKPAGRPLGQSVNGQYFRDVVQRFDLEDSSALLLGDENRQSIGLSYDEIVRAVHTADALINVSGVLRDPALLALARRRVYLDLDPAFTQLWHEAQGLDMGFAQHTDFVTIGHGLGSAECPVPTCGRSWITTLQPVVLDCWPVVPEPQMDALTTVGNWRGYGSIEYRGVFYGQKAHALRELIHLPTLTDQRLVLALAIHPDEKADLATIAANGWELVPPAQVASTPDEYRAFIQQSKGEFGVAKAGYVVSRCGWFSDRSLCYLASGRPVVAQDTGFSRFLPTGKGLLAFDTVDGAAAAIASLNESYPRHARAARAVAEEYFDSDRVLARLLDQLAITA